LLKTSSFWITVPYPGNAAFWEDATRSLQGSVKHPPAGIYDL
jgi:hypothetical protein